MDWDVSYIMEGPRALCEYLLDKVPAKREVEVQDTAVRDLLHG